MQKNGVMTFKQKSQRPSQGQFPLCQLPTKDIIQVPHAEAYDEQNRARCEEVGDARLFVGRDALRRIGVF